MKTIAVEDITESYERERNLHNQRIVERYGKHIQTDPYACYCLWQISYPKLISIIVELDDGSTKEVKFGISKHSRTFVMSYPSDIPFESQIKIDNMVTAFWRSYSRRILAGEDIYEIVLNDPNNLLKYHPRNLNETKKAKSKLLSQVFIKNKKKSN